MSRLFVATGVRDGLSGLMALRGRSAQRIAERAHVDGPAFLMEWLAVAHTFGFHVAECPLAQEAATATSLLTPGAAPGMLKDIWKTHRRLADEAYSGATPAEGGPVEPDLLREAGPRGPVRRRPQTRVSPFSESS